MPIIRNPFARRPDLNNGLTADDDNARAGLTPGFERVDTHGSKLSSAPSANSQSTHDPIEYKLSVVNDSGVYLPPSPQEKKSFWGSTKRTQSSTSTKTNSSLADIEPFSISRESFDSYRRSFDISAKSPIIAADSYTGYPAGRASLDSARMPRLPRSAVNERRFERQPPTQEEGFEDVGLGDDAAKVKEVPKKRGFFKFGDGDGNSSGAGSRFSITGRKRGQSGQGDELSSVPRPEAGKGDVQEI